MTQSLRHDPSRNVQEAIAQIATDAAKPVESRMELGQLFITLIKTIAAIIATVVHRVAVPNLMVHALGLKLEAIITSKVEHNLFQIVERSTNVLVQDAVDKATAVLEKALEDALARETEAIAQARVLAERLDGFESRLQGMTQRLANAEAEYQVRTDYDVDVEVRHRIFSIPRGGFNWKAGAITAFMGAIGAILLLAFVLNASDPSVLSSYAWISAIDETPFEIGLIAVCAIVLGFCGLSMPHSESVLIPTGLNATVVKKRSS